MTQRPIIVAEDNESILEPLMLLLESEHFEVYGARDGWEALALLSEHPTAILILDLKMPRLSGQKVLKRLDLKQTPTVILSGTWTEVPGAITLQKPVDLSTLLEAIAQAMSMPLQADQKLRLPRLAAVPTHLH